MWEKHGKTGKNGWFLISMDWFKGKSTGNHRFSHEIWGFPVNFALNQSIDDPNYPILPMNLPF